MRWNTKVLRFPGAILNHQHAAFQQSGFIGRKALQMQITRHSIFIAEKVKIRFFVHFGPGHPEHSMQHRQIRSTEAGDVLRIQVKQWVAWLLNRHFRFSLPGVRDRYTRNSRFSKKPLDGSLHLKRSEGFFVPYRIGKPHFLNLSKRISLFLQPLNILAKNIRCPWIQHHLAQTLYRHIIIVKTSNSRVGVLAAYDFINCYGQADFVAQCQLVNIVISKCCNLAKIKAGVYQSDDKLLVIIALIR